MKILHLSYSDYKGGAARAVKRIHNSLLRSNVNSYLKVNLSSESASIKNIIGPKNIFERYKNLLKATIGSTCIYPKVTKQPMKEEYLLSSKLELSNELYAISKIAGIKMCDSYNRQFGTDFRSVMPSNMYGPGDSFDPDKSHVISGLIKRFHNAKINKKKK